MTTHDSPVDPAAPARPTADVLRRIVELATRAPSVHNTQPWHWRGTPRAATLELHADWSRQMPVVDPRGRNLMLSCGAALHHAQEAARALGWSARVERAPAGPHADLLARLELSPAGVPHDADAAIDTIRHRHTDRRRFTAWPVDPSQLVRLAGEAEAWGVRAVPLVDGARRAHAEMLVHRALEVQEEQPWAAVEQRAWTDRAAPDGVPYSVLPRPEEADDRGSNRFAPLIAGVREPAVVSSDGLIVLCTDDDEPPSWLRAGEGLSALWLAATTVPLAVVPLTQVVEVDETRRELAQLLPGSAEHPLILVRIGWQAMPVQRLPHTSRRPVPEVLDLR